MATYPQCVRKKNLVQYFPIYYIKFNSIGDELNTDTNE